MPDAAKPDFRRRQYEFAAHIRDPDHQPAPEDIEDRRLGIYRELFYNNVEGFLANGFPILRKLMDDDSWHAMVRDFYARHECHSPLFLEIPREFLNYLQQARSDGAEDLPFLYELAHYEWVELALSVAEAGDGETSALTSNANTGSECDLLDSAPMLSTLAWPLSYRYPVHKISPEFIPQTPDERPTYLLVYRGPDDEVGFIELNAVSARLLALLQEDRKLSGRQALEQIAAEIQHPDPEVVVEGGRQILQEWQQRGIVLGSTN